ncbi:MBL fold metallo-hydrolase [Desulfovibrio inopinatus]|uniref:MBL fold metallo-hydrolase n=1 Tax=Desulfovibrio inopinatus TaxID=102109 RepID=UPI000484CBEC|nr:MBL fold metallo-hydrolase [Desulfovibrio inopinatus]
MDVVVFPLGPLQTNSYLAISGDAAIAVDVGGDPGAMVSHLHSKQLSLTHIVLTHLHCDHIYGVRALSEATGASVLANTDDDYLLDLDIGRGGFMGLPMVSLFAHDPLVPGEASFLGMPCKVLATPGHTPGSVSLYFPDDRVCFSGDLLFHRSIGRTDFPGGSHEVLLNSVMTQIFTLPEETVVYSGHGPETTVGSEKKNNPFFGEFAF